MFNNIYTRTYILISTPAAGPAGPAGPGAGPAEPVPYDCTCPHRDLMLLSAMAKSGTQVSTAHVCLPCQAAAAVCGQVVLPERLTGSLQCWRQHTFGCRLRWPATSCQNLGVWSGGQSGWLHRCSPKIPYSQVLLPNRHYSPTHIIVWYKEHEGGNIMPLSATCCPTQNSTMRCPIHSRHTGRDLTAPPPPPPPPHTPCLSAPTTAALELHSLLPHLHTQIQGQLLTT